MTSVKQGDPIQFHVSATRHDIDSSYYFQILRAGSTLQSMYTSSTFQGHFRNLPDSSFKFGCGWPRDTIFTVPANWASGVYLVKLIASNGDYNYIPFVVRASGPGSSSKILFQVSDNTWQAYNHYGGASFYVTYASTVSFDRPYLEGYYYPGNAADTVGDRGQRGAGQFFKWEYPLVHWLESNGYTIEYCNNKDVSDPLTYTDFLDKYNLFLSVGHDEYVTEQEKDNLLSFRQNSNPLHPTDILRHARNLAFLSGNTFFWRIDYLSGGKQMFTNYSVSYNYHTDSSPWQRGKITALNVGAWNVEGQPLTVKQGMSSHWIFRNTGLADGGTFGAGTGYPAGIGGYEFDFRAAAADSVKQCPDSVSYSRIKVLADVINEFYKYNKCVPPIEPEHPCSTLVTLPTEAAYYEYPDSSGTVKSRSKIFSAGCIQWSWGLASAADKTGKVTKNIIDGLASTFRGHVTQNMTWSGQIYLGGDVTIDSGITVTINPGTKIYFFPNNDVERTGGDTTKTRMIVKGTLTCLGTLSDSIILTSSATTPSNGDWGGVLFNYPGRGYMEFTRISYADTAISVQGDTATVVVYNSTFTHFNTAAVYSKSAKVRLGGFPFQTNPPDCGRNNILMNTATSGAKAVIKSASPSGTLKAEGNWWTQAPPPSSWFSGNNVDRTPYLLGYATPDSCNTGGESPQPPPEERIAVGSTLPTTFELGQNHPNPFNPTTAIRYALPEPARVELRIFNMLGQMVRKLVNAEKPAGFHEAVWDGRDETGRPVSTGIYLYRIKAGDFMETKRMSLIK